MKQLIFDPQPRQDFPFRDFLLNPAMQGNVHFPLSDKLMRDFVKGSFMEYRGTEGSAYFDERQGVRLRLRDMLVGRGYDMEEKTLPDHLLSFGAGGVDFPDPAFTDGKPYCKGILINPEFGNIEAAHVHLVVEMLRRAIRDGTEWVLDLGCGPVGEQKLNLENLGVERIMYADKSPKLMAMLKEAFSHRHKPGVQRKFLEIDKGELAREIDPGTIRIVIRAGVGMIDEKEARAIRMVGTSDVEMGVFNGIDGNPLEKFLDVAEDYFPNIEAHLGYQRYALLCRAA